MLISLSFTKFALPNKPLKFGTLSVKDNYPVTLNFFISSMSVRFKNFIICAVFLMSALGSQAGEKLAFTIGFHQKSSTAGSFSNSDSFKNLVTEDCVDYIKQTTGGVKTISVKDNLLLLENSGSSRFVITLSDKFSGVCSRIVVYAQGRQDSNALNVNSLGEQDVAQGSGDNFGEYSYEAEGGSPAISDGRIILVAKGVMAISRIEVYEEAEDVAEPIEVPEVNTEATPEYSENDESTVDTAGTVISIGPTDDESLLYKLCFNNDKDNGIAIEDNRIIIRPGEYEGVSIMPGELYYPVLVAYREGEESSAKEVELDPILTQPGIETETLASEAVKVTLNVSNPDAKIMFDTLNDNPGAYEEPIELLIGQSVRYWCVLEEEEATRAGQVYESPKVYYKNGTSVTSVETLMEDTAVRYYDLQGRRVAEGHLAPGVYVRTEGTTRTKILIR